MKLTSVAFAHESTVPQKHTCDGEDVSPPLAWSGVPESTASFALIMDDPDAPAGTWVHWVLWNLDGDARELVEGVARAESLQGGAFQGACWGVDTFNRVGYHGPCPPPGRPHRYVFRLYALDARLDLPLHATRAQVDAAMKGHVLDEARLSGRYGR